MANDQVKVDQPINEPDALLLPSDAPKSEALTLTSAPAEAKATCPRRAWNKIPLSLQRGIVVLIAATTYISFCNRNDYNAVKFEAWTKNGTSSDLPIYEEERTLAGLALGTTAAVITMLSVIFTRTMSLINNFFPSPTASKKAELKPETSRWRLGAGFAKGVCVWFMIFSTGLNTFVGSNAAYEQYIDPSARSDEDVGKICFSLGVMTCSTVVYAMFNLIENAFKKIDKFAYLYENSKYVDESKRLEEKSSTPASDHALSAAENGQSTTTALESKASAPNGEILLNKKIFRNVFLFSTPCLIAAYTLGWYGTKSAIKHVPGFKLLSKFLAESLSEVLSYVNGVAGVLTNLFMIIPSTYERLAEPQKASQFFRYNRLAQMIFCTAYISAFGDTLFSNLFGLVSNTQVSVKTANSWHIYNGNDSHEPAILTLGIVVGIWSCVSNLFFMAQNITRNLDDMSIIQRNLKPIEEDSKAVVSTRNGISGNGMFGRSTSREEARGLIQPVGDARNGQHTAGYGATTEDERDSKWTADGAMFIDPSTFDLRQSPPTTPPDGSMKNASSRTFRQS